MMDSNLWVWRKKVWAFISPELSSYKINVWVYYKINSNIFKRLIDGCVLLESSLLRNAHGWRCLQFFAAPNCNEFIPLLKTMLHNRLESIHVEHQSAACVRLELYSWHWIGLLCSIQYVESVLCFAAFHQIKMVLMLLLKCSCKWNIVGANFYNVDTMLIERYNLPYLLLIKFKIYSISWDCISTSLL